MSPLCDCGSERVNKLNQQVSVMRREIKNLRQMLDNATRAHRKHMISIQSAVSKVGHWGPDQEQTTLPPLVSQAVLEKGNIRTAPIGYISSCFSVKNGTPRQPSVCGPSRAQLCIQQSVFNNPEHALVGLEHYSHVWVIFLFHKNGHLSYKAKVKPPRLDGHRVGVYSTRSPHRPNALGLTLARLDEIVGDTIHLSDIDMIDGTPVLDIKPYIPEYDSPQTRRSRASEPFDSNTEQQKATSVAQNGTAAMLDLREDSETDGQSDLHSKRTDANDVGSLLSKGETGIPTACPSEISAPYSLPKHFHSVLHEAKAYVAQADVFQVNCESRDQVSDSDKTEKSESIMDRPCYGKEAYSTIADWINAPPVGSLEVRFTPQAQRELAEFLPADMPGFSQSGRPRFKFLRSPEEAAAAITGVLSADPRSVYRRTRCRDRLFFFTLDTADVTCWFGQGFVEVLQVRAVEPHIASV
ncbi:tRNA (adenine(37)-N6)-methyltransferase-like [Brachionichthys hirsutus]|uniref:tRNA (adenine(37)-N6)-methyltransferase-like n=1 Tax=Brachionichthys hirsutus TaxID=412623 RepID=UPI0036049F3F